MGLFLLIRILMALWAAGLIGAGLMIENDTLASAMRGSWIGLNAVQIGACALVGIAVWHYWSKAPAGSTFGAKVKFVIQSLLSSPKRLWLLVKELWAGTPTA